jgi:signal peptidase II
VNRVWRFLLLFGLIGATIACDRVTKQAAVTMLSGSASQSFLADTIRLEYSENPGAFLGLGATWPRAVRTALFTIGNGLLLAAVLIVGIGHRWSPPMLIGMALFFAGGTSNLIDRVARGTVVDFMNVGVGPLRTGIFNVADVAIMAGAAVMVLAGYRFRKRAQTS